MSIVDFIALEVLKIYSFGKIIFAEASSFNDKSGLTRPRKRLG